MNSRYGSAEYGDAVTTAVDRIIELNPDLVINVGDMVAGQRRNLRYRRMWSAFHAEVTEPFARAHIPMAITPGNHDASGYESFAVERAIFAEQWNARKPELDYVDDTAYPLRYSFRLGPLFFISLDATTPEPLDAAQRAWVQRQLELGRNAKARIVFGHVPLFPLTHGRETEYLGDSELERILREGGADIVLNGHDHAFYPGRRNDLRVVGTGCLGAAPRTLIGDFTKAPRSFVMLEIGSEAPSPTQPTPIDVTAWMGPSFTRTIEQSELPPYVGVPPADVVWRDDIDEANWIPLDGFVIYPAGAPSANTLDDTGM